MKKALSLNLKQLILPLSTCNPTNIYEVDSIVNYRYRETIAMLSSDVL